MITPSKCSVCKQEHNVMRAERDRLRGLLEECRNFIGIVEGPNASRFAAYLSDVLNKIRADG